jgi:hypothetical protein
MIGMPDASAPAGWYPDPSGQHQWRWWTGNQWTGHVAPVVPHHPGTPSDGQSVALLQAKEAGLDGFIPVGIWILALIAIADMFASWDSVGYYKALWHWFHRAFHAIGNQQTLPPQPTRPLWSSLFSLTSLPLIVIEIFFLIWQYRSAKVAEALGYPARRTPGWGVGFWFVPLVNLWMPYQALRDCLPPEHPGRRHVLYAWLSYVVTWVFGSTFLVVAVAVPDVTVAFATVCVAAWVSVAANSHRAMIAIATDHREGTRARAPDR